MCGASELVCLTIYILLRVMIQMKKKCNNDSYDDSVYMIE